MKNTIIILFLLVFGLYTAKGQVKNTRAKKSTPITKVKKSSETKTPENINKVSKNGVLILKVSEDCLIEIDRRSQGIQRGAKGYGKEYELVDGEHLIEVFLSSGEKIYSEYQKIKRNERTTLLISSQKLNAKPIDEKKVTLSPKNNKNEAVKNESKVISEIDILKFESELKNKINSSPGYTELEYINLIIPYLEKGINVNLLINFIHEKSAYKNSNLASFATIKQYSDFLKILIRLGVDINSYDQHGRRPLFYAIGDKKNPEITRTLLENGADPDKHTKEGNPPIASALWIADDIFLKLLIEFKCDINIEYGYDKATPLQTSIEHKSYKKFDLLLKNGANVNQISIRKTSNFGKSYLYEISPLKKAIFSQNKYFVSKLLEKKADPNLALCDSNNYCQCPLDAFFTNSTSNESDYGDISILKKLVEHGANLTHCNSIPTNYYLEAAASGELEIVRYLLNQNIDINQISTENGFPENGKGNALHLIIENVIMFKAFYGDGVLNTSKHLKMMKFLLENGINKNFRNNRRKRPIDLAKKNGLKDFVKLLR